MFIAIAWALDQDPRELTEPHLSEAWLMQLRPAPVAAATSVSGVVGVSSLRRT